MKTLGIIGGIASESTIEYYRLIIASYRKQKQDNNYPPIIINSINMTHMLDLVGANDLPGLTGYLMDEIEKLARAGADFALLASNTPHIVFDKLHLQSPIPLISIVEAACEHIKELNLSRVGLFGTSFTMRGKFYPDVFSREHISLIVPNTQEQDIIHNKYMSELVGAIFLPETRNQMLHIVDSLIDNEGIQGLILGGTELPLLLHNQTYKGIPFFDTTKIHAKKAVAEMLAP